MSPQIESKIEVEHAPGAVVAVANAFSISGPVPGNMLQLTMGEDFAKLTGITVRGEDAGPSYPPGTIVNAVPVFETAAKRVIYGEFKISIDTARQMAALLTKHADIAEAVIRGEAADIEKL